MTLVARVMRLLPRKDRLKVEVMPRFFNNLLAILSQSDARQFRLVGQRLRAALWSPLQQHLHDGDTILVSPDGDLAQLAFAALPGSDPTAYCCKPKGLMCSC